MDFWEPRVRPERKREETPPAPRKPWWGPPPNELGAAVPLRLVLARTEKAAVALRGATAFSSGVQLEVAVVRRPRRDGDDEVIDPFEPPFGRFHRRVRPQAETPTEILRFGVRFADGRKATTLDPLGWFDEEEPTIVLHQGGGGGSDLEWHSDFWLWPLPPPGALLVAVEWPREGIPFTQHEVDADLFLAAARASEPFWPEERAGSHRSSRFEFTARSDDDTDLEG